MTAVFKVVLFMQVYLVTNKKVKKKKKFSCLLSIIDWLLSASMKEEYLDLNGDHPNPICYAACYILSFFYLWKRWTWSLKLDDIPPKVSQTESSKIQLENKEHTFALDSQQECHSYPPCLPAQLASLFPPLGLETMQQASTCAGVVEKKVVTL